MTYLQQFIQKSIEGGFDMWNFLAANFDYYEEEVERGVDWEDIRRVVTGFDSVLLLDPNFWKCAGKALGWDESHFWNIAREYDINHYSTNESWKIYQHRFIDHIQDHKDPEEFFKNILTK